jgi:hypothetical protein
MADQLNNRNMRRKMDLAMEGEHMTRNVAPNKAARRVGEEVLPLALETFELRAIAQSRVLLCERGFYKVCIQTATPLS